MAFRHNKRSLTDDDSFQFACKHPRQQDFSSPLALLVETVPCDNVPEELHTSDGEGEESFKKSEGEETFVHNTVANDQEFENSYPGRNSSFSWGTSSASGEDNKSEPTVQICFSSVLSEHDCAMRELIEPVDIYSSHLDYPHRKLVSIGPEFQADVPVWGLHSIKSSDYVDPSASAVGSESVTKTMMGTCVIPMPNADISDLGNGKIGHGNRIYCCCLDEGSVRCVRQHVREAREKLRITLGEERFVELGFCEMGEDVACKWTNEEEHLFTEVVFSNPASSGKNFWDHLSRVFPRRTKQDIVSYYFNVFMLRIRAEQNRSDPLNVDSDNDEWQGSDDEFEEDEDSVVESPADHDEDVYNDGACKEECHEVDGSIDDVSVAQVSDESVSRNSPGNCNFTPSALLVDKNPQNGTEDQDSCTSYECQHNGSESYCPTDSAKTHESQAERERHERLHEDYGNDSLSGMADHGFVLEACDPKVWDFGFFTGPKKELDLLPTCNWIEEVFGKEAWNNETRDGGPGFS